MPGTYRWVTPAVALVVLGVDQFTKYLVKTNIPLGASWAPLKGIERFFSFTHVINRGIAFGLLPEWGDYFLYVGILVVFLLIFYHFRIKEASLFFQFCFGLQLGGALGNLIDRIRYGYVVDFLDFKFWPVFNVADSSITIGTLLLVLYFLKKRGGERA
ncbi:MAG: signal peptidase II [Anaerolineae bacterium]|nr:signal peptidase II [Anaerolineae bacterium]MDW8101609.1 signal peptidase II [Anaerolineae bacterium]